jgi:hemerythrin-like domain-containing protein
MRRHPELLTLSREHHAALKLARDARRAAESGDASELWNLAQRVVRFFSAELDPHFRIEEQHLLVFLAHAGERDLVQRTLAEHAELRRIASALLCPDAARLLHFADLLAAHVRFEERELFEVAQARLDGNLIQI